jgi:uncharacterized protein (DUF1499 family)
MGLLTWLTRNWADTDEPASGLAPPELPWPPEQALARLQAAIATLPRWQVVSVEPASLALHATRTTRLWHFVDDITVRLEAAAAGSRVHGRSQSRVGKGDFGQNRRNLLQLFAALEASS